MKVFTEKNLRGLDCFTPDQLKVVTGLLGYTAQAKAHWLLADFQIPCTGLARIRAQLIHRVMYGFFRRATRISATQVALPTPYLEQIGFSLRATRVSEWGLLHTDLWERTAFPATCPTAG